VKRKDYHRGHGDRNTEDTEEEKREEEKISAAVAEGDK
jgi:hypothetical protein